MFNWVVKVVPQPAAAPEEAAKTSAAHEAPKSKEVKNSVLKTTEEVSEDGQLQAGVMGWLSNGFSSALPQPPGTGRLSRANSDARQPGEDGERSGVIGWVAQGLTKVLPQPDAKYKEEEEPRTNEEHTEVYEVATMPDYDPLPHIPVVELVSEDEASEVESLTPHFPPKVVNWIKQIIPQPVILPPGAVPSEPPPKASRSSLDKLVSPPPESLSAISLDTDNKPSGVVDWFVSGLGLKMPQLVLPPKDEAEASAEVLKKASSKLDPDMVLEDLESDNEVQQKHEDRTKAASLSPSIKPPQREEAPPTQPNPQKSEASSDGAQKGSQEDAETQTGRWTPFIESIKKEAEDVALATMEERLLQERIEMARLAEEVARQTAEMAVRQMASEGTSIKLSLESQELLEEPEAELPEEEVQEQEEQEEVTGEVLPADEQKEETEDSAVKDPEPEKASDPDPQPEPEPEPEPQIPNQEDAPEAPPVTQQPQRAADAAVANTDKADEKEAEAAGDDCGVPVSCDAVKSCLMRFPLTSECFGNINAFFKENGISPPKIPPMPKLPTQLSEVTAFLPSLPPELRQELSQIRLTQVPRSVAQTLTELLPKAFCRKMPKKPRDQNQQDLELDRLVRSSPLPPPHHPQLRSRSPSPSSPHGSTLELPNVPSYPRLPPIASSPSKRPSSPPRQLSGLSNPAFFIEDDSHCNTAESVRPAVNVEDVDHEKAGGGEERIDASQTPALQDPKLTTLTVPVNPSGGRQSKGDKDKLLHSQSEDEDAEVSVPVRAWPSQSSLHSTDDVLKERPSSSASQTSAMVNERLQELVRMFKERTEKAKEKLIDEFPLHVFTSEAF
ncbi:hypothetical protein OJAV_G00061010 [Oryzias javanicus]|uniref:Uncharacterized protein n=1 Tax=Oryzias javanicus TaxID=123683 RepID=A0A3S2PFI3_ORYJA|nr:hypothetical protein OJAV_G00061010 [Oryzias javanicus]